MDASKNEMFNFVKLISYSFLPNNNQITNWKTKSSTNECGNIAIITFSKWFKSWQNKNKMNYIDNFDIALSLN